MEYLCISICRAFTCKGSRITQKVVRQQDQRVFLNLLFKITLKTPKCPRLKCQSMGANFTFGKTSQVKPVPIELLTLANLEEIDLSEKGFSKESLEPAQVMIFNFRFNRDGKRQSLKKKRHDQSKKTSFPLQIAINIYSHSR